MSWEKSSVKIIGYDKKPIKNTLLSMGKSEKLAIVFPGIGYNCQMPVLYYPTLTLLENGYDVLWVEYNYKNEGFGKRSDKEKVSWMNFDAEASYDAALRKGRYKHVLLVGKSLGTFALVFLNSKKKIDRSLWLTPLLKTANAVNVELFDDIKKVCKGGLFIIGTEDSHYDKRRMDGLIKSGAEFIAIDGADHSMEIEGNVHKSLAALEKIIKETEKIAGNTR